MPILLVMPSSNKDKSDLFLSLFKGRPDVCAKRWHKKSGYSPYCYNDFKPGICQKPKIKCTECKNSNFALLNEEQIKSHFLGKHVLGLYPLTTNDTCYLLAIDFDESTWGDDVKVVMSICNDYSVPVYAERSRSGQGCHLWFFFESEIKASLARQFGTAILDLAMQACGNIKFDSYDRLFPSQDFLQKDGFGNLIALPLQKEARERGNSVFIDAALNEIADQWRYLSQVKRISEEFISGFCRLHRPMGKNNEDARTDREQKLNTAEKCDFPESMTMIRSNGLHLSKVDLSPKALYLIRSLATYANPEFYSKQAMRQSTFGIPRITVLYEEDAESIVLPRGLETNLLIKMDAIDAKYTVLDERNEGTKVNVEFNGQLTSHQSEALSRLLENQDGVLSATTGFGKTVIAAKLIAEKKCSTLILVHTKELATQWKAGKRLLTGLLILQLWFECIKPVFNRLNITGNQALPLPVRSC